VNKHYLRNWDNDVPQVPHTEPHQRASWGLIAVALLFAFFAWLFAPSAHAQTQPWFTASVTKGISPVATVFTWTCPAGSVSAIASSTGNQAAWTGAKALSGTQNLSGIKLTADYKLDCTQPAGTASATLTWAAPTLNTDGSTLANLAGYKLYYGANSANLINNVQVANPAATTSVIDKLTSGTWYFAVTAYNAAGVESGYSNVVSKAITVPAPTVQSQTVTVTAQTQPAPPTLSTVDVVAYQLSKSTDAITLAAVGTVALGVSCKPEYDANGLNVVPRSAVTFKTSTRPLVVVAKCG
jgi:hypothetical protein